MRFSRFDKSEEMWYNMNEEIYDKGCGYSYTYSDKQALITWAGASLCRRG